MMNANTVIPCFCPFCGKQDWSIHVPAADWEAYEAGALVQDAFPYLTATQRESIISGLCADCQSGIFGDDEDEEEDD